MLCMACASEFFFIHFLMRYQFISFHFFPSFAIVFTFVNVVLCIHRFGFCRSHRFNRCVRPSICPELIVSQTVSIEFNLVSKIHRKKQRNEWEEAQGSVRNWIWNEEREKKTATKSYTSRMRHMSEIYSLTLNLLGDCFFQSFSRSLFSFSFFDENQFHLNAEFDSWFLNVYPTLCRIRRIWNEKGKVEKYTHTVAHVAMETHTSINWVEEKCCRKIRSSGEIPQH